MERKGGVAMSRKAGGERYGGGWSQKDTQAKTNSSRRDTSRAFHQARNDSAGKNGVPKNRHSSKRR